MAAALRPIAPKAGLTARGLRTRQMLLDAAEEVFGESGYHNAGIVEITQRANVALGSFYTYFPDKRTVFIELVRTLNAAMRADIRAAIQPLTHRIDQEQIGFETFFSFVERHRNLYNVIRQAEFVDAEVYRWHYETLGESYEHALRRAQLAGDVRADLDPATVAASLMAIAEAIGLRWVLWRGIQPDATVIATLRAMLTSILAPLDGPP